MSTSSRILACLVALPAALLTFHGSLAGGELYREGIFLASLESSEVHALPPLVAADRHALDSSNRSSAIRLVGGQTDHQRATAGSVTQVLSAESVTQVSEDGLRPASAEFVRGHSEPAPLPCETQIRCEAETIGCRSCPDCEQAGTGKIKQNRMQRRIYFSQQGNPKKCLYPVARPYCQPAFGIHETCWRQVHPNPCYPRCEETLHGEALPPEPQATPLAPPSANQVPSSGSPAPRPYE
jgi:hypothetical protein